jgi:ABC-2 type transport system ATP-binding protein
MGDDDVAVEASGLHKAYGRHPVLTGVDVRLERGSVLALLGRNGAGKTTTVRILSTLLRADSGRVRVAGFDVVADRAQVRRRISLTGQYAAVDELQTGEENLRVVGRLRGLGSAPARARAGAAGPVRPRRGRLPPGGDVLRRDAAAARSGHEPGRRSGGAVPRRADDGT